MIEITSLEELKQLKIKEVFYKVTAFGSKNYYFAGVHPCTNSLVMAVDGGSYTSIETFSDVFFYNTGYKKRCVILKGTYDSKVIGEAMIKLLNDDIERIEKIYLIDKIEG